MVVECGEVAGIHGTWKDPHTHPPKQTQTHPNTHPTRTEKCIHKCVQELGLDKQLHFDVLNKRAKQKAQAVQVVYPV